MVPSGGFVYMPLGHLSTAVVGLGTAIVFDLSVVRVTVVGKSKAEARSFTPLI
jgi:hypothetical protein